MPDEVSYEIIIKIENDTTDQIENDKETDSENEKTDNVEQENSKVEGSDDIGVDKITDTEKQTTLDNEIPTESIKELEDDVDNLQSLLNDVKGKSQQGIDLGSYAFDPSGLYVISKKILPFIEKSILTKLPALLSSVLGGVIAGAVIGKTVVAPLIAKQLAKKGWPWNRDWHSAVGDELNGLMETEQRRNRLLGTSSAVYYSNVGFQRVRDTEVYNTKYNLSSERISRISNTQNVVRFT